MSLGERIYKLRKSANLSQEEFGNMFNVSRQSISKWESNQVQPELKTIIEIAKFFNVSLDSLLLDDCETKSEEPLFVEVYKRKLKFVLGCIIVAIGVIWMCLSMYINKEIIAYYGTILKYLFISLKDESYHVIIYYMSIVSVIGFGGYIISTVIKTKDK